MSKKITPTPHSDAAAALPPPPPFCRSNTVAAAAALPGEGAASVVAAPLAPSRCHCRHRVAAANALPR